MSATRMEIYEWRWRGAELGLLYSPKRSTWVLKSTGYDCDSVTRCGISTGRDFRACPTLSWAYRLSREQVRYGSGFSRPQDQWLKALRQRM